MKHYNFHLYVTPSNPRVRDVAAQWVASNPCIRCRLPRLTKYAEKTTNKRSWYSLRYKVIDV